jgi:hypothetical protein
LRHRRYVFLDFNPENPPGTATVSHDQRNDPAPRPQIDQIIPFPETGKMCEQQGIYREAVPLFLLDDPEAAPKYLIDSLAFFYQDILVHLHSKG